MRLTRLLTADEYSRLGDEAVAYGYYRNDKRVFLPGMGWPMPWYFNPANERDQAEREKRLRLTEAGEEDFLSVHYWRDWSDKRPPLCVVCPNGEWWEIDRKSSNGKGWTVTGEWPNLTCSPSIVVNGYHGYLRNGEFTPDLEGRGRNGTALPLAPRSL